MRTKPIDPTAQCACLLLTLLPMIVLFTADAAAQLPVPRYDNFNDGFPVDWVREEPDDTVRWEATEEYGWYGSPGLMVDHGDGSDGAEAWAHTPLLNLTTVENPLLTFKVATIKNNFLPPILSLWYNDGDGWKRLHGWGPTLFTEENEEIESTENFFPTLAQENIQWVDITFPLDDVATAAAIRFEFRAEMINGGWLLLDEMKIEAGMTNGVEETGSFALDLE